ncbi:MAG: iron-sulfur cluster assembly scaffold protein [Endomicrobiaceae bacterium]
MNFNDEYFGRMNDPSAFSFLKGPCGDEIEFYLAVENNKITDVKYYTEGCGYTKLCGSETSRLAKGRNIGDALSISSAEVMNNIKNLPEDHMHCSILAVSAFYGAVADYLLKS